MAISPRSIHMAHIGPYGPYLSYQLMSSISKMVVFQMLYLRMYDGLKNILQIYFYGHD